MDEDPRGRETEAARHQSSLTATAHILSSTHHLNTDWCSRGNDWMHLALLITEYYSSSGNSMLREMCLT